MTRTLALDIETSLGTINAQFTQVLYTHQGGEGQMYLPANSDVPLGRVRLTLESIVEPQEWTIERSIEGEKYLILTLLLHGKIFALAQISMPSGEALIETVIRKGSAATARSLAEGLIELSRQAATESATIIAAAATSKPTAMVDDARELAYTRFAELRHGNRPYTDHLTEVVTILREFGYTSDEWAAAGWLHDIVEDTGLSIHSIRSQFGDRVADLVWAVTGQGENRKARNTDAYRKLRQMPDAVPLKLANRLANVCYCSISNDKQLLAMYRKEWPGFRGALGDLGPREMWEKLTSLMEP